MCTREPCKAGLRFARKLAQRVVVIEESRCKDGDGNIFVESQSDSRVEQGDSKKKSRIPNKGRIERKDERERRVESRSKIAVRRQSGYRDNQTQSSCCEINWPRATNKRDRDSNHDVLDFYNLFYTNIVVMDIIKYINLFYRIMCLKYMKISILTSPGSYPEKGKKHRVYRNNEGDEWYPSVLKRYLATVKTCRGE